MKGILLLMILILFTNPCNAQQGYQSIISNGQDSIIHQFESHYKNASSVDRSKFETFTRSIEMINPKREVSRIIKLFGKDFYKKPVDKFVEELDLYISASFPELPNDDSYWDKKLEKFKSSKNELNEFVFDVSELWDNPNHKIVLGFRPKTIVPISKGKSRDIVLEHVNWIKNHKERDYLTNKKLNDSILKVVDSLESTYQRFEMRLTLAYNLIASNMSREAESILKWGRLGGDIFNEQNISPKGKLDLILGVNKLISEMSPVQYYHGVLSNYAFMRAILENPTLFKDDNLNTEMRKKSLRFLDNFEIQTLLGFTENTSGNDKFLDVTWNVFNRTLGDRSKRNNILDYVLIAELKSEKLFLERFDANYYQNWRHDIPGYQTVLSEHWSLLQAIEELNQSPSEALPFMHSRLLRSAILHFISIKKPTLAGNVIINGISNLEAHPVFLYHHSTLVLESFQKKNDLVNYNRWKKRLKINYNWSTTTLKSLDVIDRINEIAYVPDDQMNYFLSPQFLNDLQPLLKSSTSFALRNNIDANYLSVIEHYCQKNGEYKNAFYAIKLYNEFITCNRNLEGFSEEIIQNRSFVDNLSSENKSLENNELVAYQKELTSVNEELKSTNNSLIFALVSIAVLAVLSIILYLFTRKIKKQLEKERNTLEAISLSIGQIGHLAKNAISEIHNSYFKAPTPDEIDIGKKALKRLRNVFQKFEENGYKTSQKVENEILFAADLILIQNRKFSEQKTKQDILDRIACVKNPLVFSKVVVPIYTVVNILDNIFKHSDLSDDIQVTINGMSYPNSPKGFSSEKTLTIECKSKLPEKSNSIGGGTGTEYVAKMLKNYSNSNYAYYVKGQTTKSGYRHTMLLMQKDQNYFNLLNRKR